MLKWTGIEGAKTAEESPSTGVASCQSPLPFPRSSNLSAHEPREGTGGPLGEGGWYHNANCNARRYKLSMEYVDQGEFGNIWIVRF